MPTLNQPEPAAVAAPSHDLQECPACHTIEDLSYMTGVVHQGQLAYFCVDCPLPE
jgi:hypothetical protein